jgi:hypothetical protein
VEQPIVGFAGALPVRQLLELLRERNLAMQLDSNRSSALRGMALAQKVVEVARP